jgi:hypothetical protein
MLLKYLAGSLHGSGGFGIGTSGIWGTILGGFELLLLCEELEERPWLLVGADDDLSSVDLREKIPMTCVPAGGAVRLACLPACLLACGSPDFLAGQVTCSAGGVDSAVGGYRRRMVLLCDREKR